MSHLVRGEFLEISAGFLLLRLLLLSLQGLIRRYDMKAWTTTQRHIFSIPADCSEPRRLWLFLDERARPPASQPASRRAGSSVGRSGGRSHAQSANAPEAMLTFSSLNYYSFTPCSFFRSFVCPLVHSCGRLSIRRFTTTAEAIGQKRLQWSSLVSNDTRRIKFGAKPVPLFFSRPE